jgi:hypothetical protein
MQKSLQYYQFLRYVKSNKKRVIQQHFKNCFSHGGDDKKQGEVHPNRTVKALSAKVVGDVGNNDEHQGGEAGREQEAENLPPRLDPDDDTALVFQARAEGEASNGIGSQL